LPYNAEPHGDTLQGFRQVVQRGKAHCLERRYLLRVLEQPAIPLL
jgi:hypothetical protein